MQYYIYGLHIEGNIVLPCQLPNTKMTDDIVDVHITFDALGTSFANLLNSNRVNYYTSPLRNDAGQPHLIVDTLSRGLYFHFQYGEGVEFLFNRAGTRVWGSWTEHLCDRDAADYLLGPVLGFILRLRGVTCLHASCLVVGDTAFALVGPSGAGKSTTAAALARMGNQVISDDILPLTESDSSFLAVPGYSRISLWPEAVDTLYGDPDAHPRHTPSYDKRYIGIAENADLFRITPAPLSVIYILDSRSDNQSAPYIESERAAVGMVTLAANTYRTELLDTTMRQQEFVFLSRLVSSIPIRRITPPRDIRRLPELCGRLLDDFCMVTTQSHLFEQL